MASPRHAVTRRASPRIWLRAAGTGLFVLAGAAAVVSFTAQYRLVNAARHLEVAAALEAAIPDVAALVFACLGVALALHGRRAVRSRLLNATSAGASVFMNVIAAAPGWRDLAIWAMPPVAYVLASDTLIGVVRAEMLARQGPAVLAEEATLLAIAAGLLLWLVRLTVAPASTLAGFRGWVLDECPVAPGRRAARSVQAVPTLSTSRDRPRGHRGSRPRIRLGRDGTKTARFLALVAEFHGPFSEIPLASVSRISTEVAPQVDLNAGAARAALRRSVLTARNGGQS